MTKSDRILVLLADGELPIGRWAEGCDSVTGVGTLERVRAARRRFSDVENAMFTPGSRYEIPWAEGRFTLIVDGTGAEPTGEMMRVLAPGGRVVRDPEAE
jgi:hypothetical protein